MARAQAGGVGDPERNRYARMAILLNQSRPSHQWASKKASNSCTMCHPRSPFSRDRASHLFIIQEEPL